MLPGSPGIQRKSHLDGRGGTTQAYGSVREYRAGGRRPFQNYQGRKEVQPSLKDELVKFLKKNLDVFAWSHEDTSGINERVVEHCLNVDIIKRLIQ